MSILVEIVEQISIFVKIAKILNFSQKFRKHSCLVRLFENFDYIDEISITE